MMMPTKALAAALLGLAVTSRGAAAQCADGGAPPCAPARVAVARPLDDRTWLILPFDNVARDQSLDVVREASVTLMYSSMSQWSDIRVVDDTRVADLMRDIPAGTRLGQEAGFGLARRVGAGRLVMGTLLKEGARTRVQAAVFDVRAGQRLRSPSTMTVGTDSLSAVFGGLAQLVLGVAAPSGASPGDVGTKNTEALRAYAAGLETERRFVQDTAVIHYRRAISLDSTFGLAHFRLSQTLGELPDEPPTSSRGALETAQRFSSGLPRRERVRVATMLASDAPSRCAAVERMLAADSLDAWAWWAHGSCQGVYLRPTTLAAALHVDNAILADMRRAIGLDSSFYLPVQGILNGGSFWRDFCTGTGNPMTCPDSQFYNSFQGMHRDTVVHFPHRPYVEGRAYLTEPELVDAIRTRREFGRDVVARFLAANPGHVAAHLQMAQLLTAMGDLTGADRELRAASGAARLRGWRRQYYLNRFYLELMRGRPAQAVTYADSIYADPTAVTQPQAGSIVGRYSLDAAAAHRGNDSLIALRQAWLPVFAGVLPPDWDRLQERYAWAYAPNAAQAQREASARSIVSVGNLVAYWMRRKRAPSDTAHPEPLYRFQAWFALGDTARARVALQESDAQMSRRAPGAHDDGAWLFNAEGHLLLADSAGALSRLRDYQTRWPRQVQINVAYLMTERANPVNNISRAYGRIWLLHADLALAAGSHDEARQYYQFVVDLWSGGEAPVQPLVARARAALATLGPVRR